MIIMISKSYTYSCSFFLQYSRYFFEHIWFCRNTIQYNFFTPFMSACFQNFNVPVPFLIIAMIIKGDIYTQ